MIKFTRVGCEEQLQSTRLLDYGARELVEEFEAEQTVQPSVRMATVSSDVLTAQHLKIRYGLTYSLEVCTQAVQDELKNTVGQGRPLTELRGAERQAVLKDKSLFKTYLRMNPEPKLPSNDYPEGRLKMRFLAMGNTTPEKWMADIPTDAPVVMQSTVKTMLAQGVDTGDMAADDIVVGDISGAFNESDDYDDGKPRHAIWQPYRNAALRVFRMDSPLYGTLEAPMYWHKTYVNWVTSVGYTVCHNDKSVFVHPKTKHRVAKHVDDLFARGQKQHNDWFMSECS